MKKLLVFFALAVYMACAVGCAKAPDKNILTPKKVAILYLDARIAVNPIGAYTYISNIDKETMNRLMYQDNSQWLVEMNLLRNLASRSRYTILDESINKDGGKATVTVKIQTPAIPGFKELMPPSIVTDTASESTIATARKLVKTLTYEDLRRFMDDLEKEHQTLEEVVPINLVREEQGWKVFLDYKHRNEHDTTEAKMLGNIVDSAAQRKQEQDARAEADGLREIQRLDALMAKKTPKQSAGPDAQKQDKQAYMAKLAIKETNVVKSADGGKILLGELVNNGERILSDVEITVHGLDDYSADIFVLKYHPLRDPKSSFKIMPNLKRAYLMRNDGVQFSYMLGYTLKDWTEKYDVEITNIEFAE